LNIAVNEKLNGLNQICPNCRAAYCMVVENDRNNTGFTTR
jgi:ribosomal protein S27AE